MEQLIGVYCSAGDKPDQFEIISALVIASGVVIIAIFGSGEGGGGDDDTFGIDSNSDTRRQLLAVIDTFGINAQRTSFIAFMACQGALLAGAAAVVSTQAPSKLASKISWGAMGGVLQGNVYFLTTASKMAVVDFPEACTLGMFWVYTVAFIIIASTGLALNALAMRFYNATFCVCSFVGEFRALLSPHPIRSLPSS